MLSILIKLLILINLQFLIADEYKFDNISFQDANFSEERLSEIDKSFKKAIENNEIPGVVIAIARYNKVVYLKAFGMQDKEKNIVMSTDSIFRIYSMTKPIVSAGVMILNERGKLFLSDNLSNYIDNFTDMHIAYERKIDNKLEEILLKQQNQIKISDLLTHTSGITYGVFGNSYAKRVLKASKIGKLNLENISLDNFISELAKLPLAHDPGTTWEYGRSMEVAGKIIEKLSNKTLDNFLYINLFKPLNMNDTGFYVSKKKWNRIAEPFKSSEPELINIRNKPKFLTGGHGLVSTINDYMKFCMMLFNKGSLNDKTILSRKTIEYMTSNHLGKEINRNIPYYLPGKGYGFGLGFAIREQDGISMWPGSKGDYYWGGYAGTYFWIDPKEELIVIMMSQSVKNRTKFRMILRNLVYEAME